MAVEGIAAAVAADEPTAAAAAAVGSYGAVAAVENSFVKSIIGSLLRLA